MVLRAVFLLLPLSSHGVILPEKVRNDTPSFDSDAAKEEDYHRSSYVPAAAVVTDTNAEEHRRHSMHVPRAAKVSSKGFYRVNERRHTDTSTQDRLALEDGPESISSNATNEPVLSERMRGSIMAEAADLISIGTVIGVLIVLLCLAVAVYFVVMELRARYSSSNDFGDDDGPLVQDIRPPPRSGRFSASSSMASYMQTSRLRVGTFSSGSQNFVPKALTKITPICPELVLVVESWYAIGFDSIDAADGPIPIYGRGQTLLMTARIQHGSVTISMGQQDPQKPLLASINKAGGAAGGFLINDKHKRPYGDFIPIGQLSYSLCRDEGGKTKNRTEVMRMKTDDQTGRILLVNPDDETILAHASKLHGPSELPTQEEYMGIVVVAGMDPILTILCILGAMALTAS